MNSSFSNDKVESVRVKIKQFQLLDKDGHPISELPEALKHKDTVVALYQGMLINRIFDEQAVSLQRTGRLGTFASALGQEAPSVGAVLAMQEDDLFVPSFREQGGQLARGVTPQELLSYWGGDERGSAYKTAVNDFPVCIPVASQYTQATGVALAFKLKKEKRVVVVFGGDGSTSKGDFYEAINMAGVWNLPIVFFIVNNQWAISTPRTQQTHAGTLAQKALAGGVPGMQVDGNDAMAVYQASKETIEDARQGKGPALIESVTYRMSDHTTADDASRYRDEAEVAEQSQYDPIRRVKYFLKASHNWSEAEDKALYQNCSDEVAAGVSAYLATETAAPEQMFDYLFAVLPEALNAQRDFVIDANQK